MTSAWGVSWGSAWGNSWGATTTARKVVGSTGGSRRVKLEDRKAWDKTLSPKNWREIQALLKAEREVADKADDVANVEAKEALNEAADSARDALEAFQEAEANFLKARQLQKALDKAAAAKTAEAMITASRTAALLAQAIQQELDDDEEDAIEALLLS